MAYINFSANYKNITSALKNNKLYLTSILSITIPDGTYTISDINNSILTIPISGLYYKLWPNFSLSRYDVYSYTNLNDWTSNLNGINTNAPITDISSLNYKLSIRPNLLEAFKIWCNLFDIHENNITSFKLSNEIIIPIASNVFSRNHFEFNDISFKSILNQSCEI